MTFRMLASVLSPKSHRSARVPSHTEIADRAYALFQARDGQHGDDLEDWLIAERALKEEYEDFDAEDEPLELDR